ncbi:MAG: type II toxin-antitoxin system Phd/YefM family antitoxin [Deltaproteobacteria bacterium]|nr:type II toxin-antitoxin system Phd/YefM family antitoxin [Deltaproteobacteria bacterium]MBI3386451.1 type II toxin-antitoxin system Phd/YefM family antitoxin [Deltaproteobacteria bacterium]
MKAVALSELRYDLSRYLRQAAKEEIVITRRGKAAGILIGFDTDDDWFDYRLENDPRFLDRAAAARSSLRSGRGVRLENLDEGGRSSSAAAPDRSQRRVSPKTATSRRGPRPVTS